MAALDLSGLIAQVDRSEGIKASAVTLIIGFAAKIAEAVAAALLADDAADQGSIDAANAAINEVTAKMLASDTALAAAVANHSTPPATTNR